jgi:hypothetical protein
VTFVWKCKNRSHNMELNTVQGALRMVGRGAGAVIGTVGALLNTGIPGMSGNLEMRYTGVVRMRGMPYRFVF